MLSKISLMMVLLMMSLACFNEVQAQSDERKFEVGGQFSVLRLPTLTTTTITNPCTVPPCPLSNTFARGRESDPGFGGRVGYNFSRSFALEAEGNFFPRDRSVDGGRKTEGLFGAKVGKRFDSAGLFAKARPGFVRFSQGDYRAVGGCITIFPPPAACFEPVAKTNLALDLGGVVEFYPSKNTIVRFDGGDTIIRFGNRNVTAIDAVGPGLGPVRLVVIPVAAETKHNFQVSAGVAVRF